ncbi:MAG: aldo/keto reductase [Arthrobacter sp.]|uniref:aldo/keto reductase n=1 Tax=Arthrobacter sp. TaxID=1667 RepID=UPI00348E8A17
MPLPQAPELDIFPLALGANTFGWTSDEAESHEVLDAFVADGGNLIDTADGYSAWVPGNTGGESESIIGSWLARSDRPDDLVIASKVSTHPEFKGLSARNVASAAEASLSRLGTETIDLYYAHFDDPDNPLGETVEAFGRLVAAGKIRHIGLSNYSPERVREWIALSDELGVPRPVALQPRYNLVAREPYESAYAPLAEEYGLAVLPYSALASGFLTGKYRTAEDFSGVPRRQGVENHFTEDGLAIVAQLRDIGSRLGEEASTVALAWLRSRPNVAAPIASARTISQLAALLASTRLNLSPADLRTLDEVSAPDPARN